MIDILGEFFFLIFSFITWLSVSFNVTSHFIDEKKIFSKQINAISFYLINSAFAIVATAICYILVCYIQITI